MNYEGDLYGKVGGMVFKTGKTSKDWDNMETRLKELEAENLALKQANEAKTRNESEVCPNCKTPRPKHYQGEGSCESCAF